MSAFTPSVFRSWKLGAGRVPCYFILCLLLLEATPQTRNVAMGYLLDAPSKAEEKDCHQTRKLIMTGVQDANTMSAPVSASVAGTPQPQAVWGSLFHAPIVAVCKPRVKRNRKDQLAFEDGREYPTGAYVRARLDTDCKMYFLAETTDSSREAEESFVAAMEEQLKGKDFALALWFDPFLGKWHALADFTTFVWDQEDGSDRLYIFNANDGQTRDELKTKQLRGLRAIATKVLHPNWTAPPALTTSADLTTSGSPQLTTTTSYTAASYYLESAIRIGTVIMAFLFGVASTFVLFVCVVLYLKYQNVAKDNKRRRRASKNS
eukprot:GHVS01035320.1.p1 GENE.GHVS01035320.1~~GHVS01035320.1.p1  ORF type:complete len:320 (+),score=35.62 GHVS01035320.1:131-1090(+)